MNKKIEFSSSDIEDELGKHIKSLTDVAKKPWYRLIIILGTSIFESRRCFLITAVAVFLDLSSGLNNNFSVSWCLTIKQLKKLPFFLTLVR